MLTASAGGIRAQIDRITAAETAKAIEPALGRPRPPRGWWPGWSRYFSASKAEHWREQISALGESPAAVDRGGRHARGPGRTPRAVRSDGALLHQTSTNGAAVAAPLTLAGLLAT